MSLDADPEPALDPARAREYSLDQRSRAFILRVALGTFAALTGIAGLIGVASASYDKAAIAGTGFAVYVLLYLGARRFGADRVGVLTAIWYFALATVSIAFGRGVNDVTMVLVPAGMVLCALLLERRFLLPLIVLAVGVVAAVGTAKVNGLLGAPSAEPAGPAEVLVCVLLLAVAGMLTYLIERSLFGMFTEQRRAEAIVLDSRRQIEARNEALELVNRLARRLQHNLDLDTIARETVQVLSRHSRPPRTAVYLLDDSGKPALVATGGPGNVERAEDRPALDLPLVFDGWPLGHLELSYDDRRAMSPLDRGTFEAIGQAVSLAIANSRHLADLEHQAYHDSLTSLPNRAGLHREFESRVSQPASAREIALVMLDLTRFREINEALGHHLGDALLISIGDRLERRLKVRRPSLFRVGADVFAALLPSAGGLRGSEQQAAELLAILEHPVEVGGMALELSASVGLAVYPSHAGDSHELLRCADIALHEAKRTGSRLTTYSKQFDEHTPERLELMAELRAAVHNGELTLYFQPQIALATGLVAGFEALVRWAHPRLGLLPPGRFLHLAETSEVIHPLTHRVVEDALVQLREWTDSGHDIRVAINLSVRNLLDANCAQRLEEIIQRVGVDPGRVEFELTETALMTNPPAALEMLQRIAHTGACLALDDFGTGYSSLTYLRRFPFQALKIDRSFVGDLLGSRQGKAIVHSTVQLAQGMGLRTVAEGVENRATVDELRAMGCELAQGYFFAPAGPALEVARHFEAGGRWSAAGLAQSK